MFGVVGGLEMYVWFVWVCCWNVNVCGLLLFVVICGGVFMGVVGFCVLGEVVLCVLCCFVYCVILFV